MRKMAIAVACMIVAASAPHCARAQQGASDPDGADAAGAAPLAVRASAGMTVSDGHYGDPVATRVLVAPVAVKLRKGAFSLRISVPYVHVVGPRGLIDTSQAGSDDGAGSAAADDGQGPCAEADEDGAEDRACSGSGSGSGSGAGTGGASRTRGGLGDVGVGIRYDLALGQSAWLGLGARAKLPTASRARRLGTGKFDFTLETELGRDFGPASIYVATRRRFLGKPTGTRLRDTWGASSGASYRLGHDTVVGADYDWQRSSTPGLAPISEATAWLAVPLSDRLRAQLSATTGLSSNSARYATGLSLSWKID